MRTYSGAGLLSTAEAARRLGVDYRTLQTWLKNRRLPGFSVQIGRRTFIRAAVLEQLLGGGFSLCDAAGAQKPAGRKENGAAT